MSDFAWMQVFNVALLVTTLLAYILVGSPWVFLILALVKYWGGDCKCGQDKSGTNGTVN